jgi:hypothetical protein
MTGEIERLDRICMEREAQVKKEQDSSADLGCRVVVLSAEIERRNAHSGVSSK